jgi:prepilin-type N-terminal cleavage/methylation domain-containing protein
MKIRHKSSYFSLIELLVVITILPILMSLLQPALLIKIIKHTQQHVSEN